MFKRNALSIAVVLSFTIILCVIAFGSNNMYSRIITIIAGISLATTGIISVSRLKDRVSRYMSLLNNCFDSTNNTLDKSLSECRNMIDIKTNEIDEKITRILDIEEAFIENVNRKNEEFANSVKQFRSDIEKWDVEAKNNNKEHTKKIIETMLEKNSEFAADITAKTAETLEECVKSLKSHNKESQEFLLRVLDEFTDDIEEFAKDTKKDQYELFNDMTESIENQIRSLGHSMNSNITNMEEIFSGSQQVFNDETKKMYLRIDELTKNYHKQLVAIEKNIQSIKNLTQEDIKIMEKLLNG